MKYRYAVSDIHGNARGFLRLLDHVDPNPEELVVLGDLVNHGLQAWEVYEECAQLVDEGAHFIRGNHDHWHRMYYGGAMPKNMFEQESIGGITTIQSIILAERKYGEDHVRETLQHVWDSMEWYIEEDDYIFVHAGVDPFTPFMKDQDDQVLMLGSPAWKNPKLDHEFDQTIIFGHTPTMYLHPNIKEDDMKVWHSPKRRKMGIDTGSAFYHRLTMIDLYEGIAYSYDFEKRKVIESGIPYFK